MKLQAIALVKLQIDICAIIIQALENQITMEPRCPNSLQSESDAWAVHILACL